MKKLSGKTKDRYLDLKAHGSVRVERFSRKGELQGVHITLQGKLRWFPSNYYQPGTRKQGQRSYPFIRRSPECLAYFAAAKELFEDACKRCGIDSPTFGKERVLVRFHLAKRERGGRFDSHNQSKGLGDWLEEIGLIENDSNAEIRCLKKNDYESKVFGDIKESKIIVQLLQPALGTLAEAEELLNALSLGREWF